MATNLTKIKLSFVIFYSNKNYLRYAFIYNFYFWWYKISIIISKNFKIEFSFRVGMFPKVMFEIQWCPSFCFLFLLRFLGQTDCTWGGWIGFNLFPFLTTRQQAYKVHSLLLQRLCEQFLSNIRFIHSTMQIIGKTGK